MKYTLMFFCALLIIACSPCENMNHSQKNNLPIIIMQDGFTKEEFNTHAEYIKKTILEKEPFASKPYLDFRVIHSGKICTPGSPLLVMKGNTVADVDALPPLECNISQIQKLTSTCKVSQGKIIIVTNETITSQTTLSYQESGVMFLDMKNQPPEIIQHEFAHFFGLVDEKAVIYSHADGPGRETAPNCVATYEEARNWDILYGDNHTYPQGCAGSALAYKPESGTLLDAFPDPSDTYGVFDTWYLGRVMDCCYAKEEHECSNFFASYPQWEGCRE